MTIMGKAEWEDRRHDVDLTKQRSEATAYEKILAKGLARALDTCDALAGRLYAAKEYAERNRPVLDDRHRILTVDVIFLAGLGRDLAAFDGPGSNEPSRAELVDLLRAVLIGLEDEYSDRLGEDAEAEQTDLHNEVIRVLARIDAEGSKP